MNFTQCSICLVNTRTVCNRKGRDSHLIYYVNCVWRNGNSTSKMSLMGLTVHGFKNEVRFRSSPV
jgi:hypothetical protein